MAKSIAARLLLPGALTLVFLFLKPTPAFAVCNYVPNSYTSYTEQSTKCVAAGEDCKVSGSSVTESGHGCVGCDGTVCINEFWSQKLSCSGNADAQAYCGQANCKGQGQTCTANSECCAGTTCNASGICAGSCSGQEKDATTCSQNGGTWTQATENKDSCGRRQLTNNQHCISSFGISGWCYTDGCDNKVPTSCSDTGGCAAAGCIYIQDATIQNISCSYCKCGSSPPPPPTCNNNWSLNSQIGFVNNGNNAVQTAINSGDASACSNASVQWYQSSTVNIPAVINNGNVQTKRICARANTSIANINKINIADATNNITIALSTTGGLSSVYNLNNIRANNPGEVAVIQSSRPQSAFNGTTYCAKSDPINFCTSTLPLSVANGYPDNGQFVTDTPLQPPPNQEGNAAADANKGTEPLTWGQLIEDGENTNGILIVGVAYRGNKNGDGSPYDMVFENSADDGDPDDYVKRVTIRLGTATTTTDLTRIPGSHSQYIEPGDRGGKRHVSLWYIKTATLPIGQYVLNVIWKGNFPDPMEAAAGSIIYSGVDQANPFVTINKKAGKVTTCDASGNCSNEPSIINSVTSSNTTMAVIAGQTDQNYQNPPALQPDARNRWRRLTNNKNIYGQGADKVGFGTTTPSNVDISWKYGFAGATWAISSIVLRPATTRTTNTLYWQNIDWGAVCGTIEKHNYVFVKRLDGSVVLNGIPTTPGRADFLSLLPYYGTGANQINPNPSSDTTYKWYVESSNIAGGTANGNPNRVKSPEWSFKVKKGPNITASIPNPVTKSGTTGAATFRISNSGGSVMDGVTASFDPGNGGAIQNFTNTGGWPKSIPIGGYIDQGVSFALPSPGTYTARVTAFPATGVTETNTVDNVATAGYTVDPRAAYFQAIRAGLAALGNITSSLPTTTDAVSRKGGTINDAGILSANSAINVNGGLYSQNGNNPGWNRVGLTAIPRLTELTYTNLFNTIFSNAGINPSTASTSCSPVPCSYSSGSYTVYVYFNTTDINSFINSAPTTGTTILIPAAGAAAPTLSALTAAQIANKRVVVFVNTNLNITGNINVSPTDNNSGLVVIVNGNITINDAVTQLDGLYIFSGTLNTNSGATLSNPLAGYGSLIGTGASAFTLRRTYGTTGAAANPAELWTYQPKYLWLFRNILTQPSYSWKELPPQ